MGQTTVSDDISEGETRKEHVLEKELQRRDIINVEHLSPEAQKELDQRRETDPEKLISHKEVEQRVL